MCFFQVHYYYEKLDTLEICVKAIVKEQYARTDLTDSSEHDKELHDVYEVTNEALDKMVPGRTKSEWQLTEKIDKHRINPMQERTVARDGIFYSYFIQEVLDFGLAALKDIEELPMWKKNYDFCKLSKQIYSIETTMTVMNYTCSNAAKVHGSHMSTNEFASFLDLAELSINKMKLNDSHETSEFLRNSQAIFGNNSQTSSYMKNSHVPDAERSCNKTLQKLVELHNYKHKRRQDILKVLLEHNSSSLKENIIIFCCVLITVFLTVACIVLFGYLLRYQCLLSVGVSDWLENVMAEVKEQEVYREYVLQRVSSIFFINTDSKRKNEPLFHCNTLYQRR